MSGRRDYCERCGARLGAPYICWFDGENDFDLDEWAQRCPACRHEHTWANIGDPGYNREAWHIARMPLEIAEAPNALELVAHLPPEDPVRRHIEETRAALEARPKLP